MKTHSINPRALGTNSLTNAILVASPQPKPEVGMGATIVMWTDLYACTIVSVQSVRGRPGAKSIYIQRDIATRTDSNGMSKSQDYAYAPDPDAKVEVFTLRKTGRYVRRGERINGTHLVVGERDHFIDPSF